MTEKTQRTMIKVEHLQKKFGDLEVLKDVSLEVREKEVVVVIGPSGSGKSTILRCLNHLEIPSGGKITIDGIPLEKGANLNAIRREVGMVFQRFNLFPNMTVLENIMLAPVQVRGLPKEEVRKKALALLARVGLESKADAMPDQLSGGQQQRVAIARALATKPAIVLADEPTGNLDSKTSQDVLSLMKVSSEKFGQTIVMITHNEEIAQLAHHIVHIEDGKIVKGRC